MATLTALTGGFPRTRRLANAIRRYDKRKLDSQEFDKILFEETLKNVQRASRYLDILTDGMYTCDDILNPFIKDIEGVKRGWLVRFYDNNFFVRNPIIISKIKLKNNPGNTIKRIELVKKLQKETPGKKYRIPIPGPLTFVDFAVVEREVYGDKAQLARDYVNNVLKPVIEILTRNRLTMEVHEPSLGSPSVKNVNINEIYGELEDFQENLHIIQYFNKPSQEELSYLTKRFLVGVDLVENPRLLSNRKEWLKGDRLQAGVVDARNTKAEKHEEIAKNLKTLSKEIDTLLVSSNTTLEFLPEVPARKKIRILYSIKIRLWR